MRYGLNNGSLRGFSWRKSPITSSDFHQSRVTLSRLLPGGFTYPRPEKASTYTSDRRMILFCASPLRCKRNCPSAGILTCCPSSTPFGLDLGPTDPELTNIAQGNLRFTAHRILTGVIATYSDILTSKRSSTPCRYAFMAALNAPLPRQSASSGSQYGPIAHFNLLGQLFLFVDLFGSL